MEHIVDGVGMDMGARLTVRFGGKFVWALYSMLGTGMCLLYRGWRCPLLGGFKCISVN